MTRKVTIGTEKYTTEVWAIDEPGAGNAHHIYEIIAKDTDGGQRQSTILKFQNGPIKEVGVNGLHNEDLIAIILDRLHCFQKGDFVCKENGKAIVDLYGALQWLRERTKKREKRGVEGTSEI
jgi:hypothetical protein